MATLQAEIINSFKNRPVPLPAEAAKAFAADQARFAALGVPSTVPAVGEVFPDGKLIDAHGNTTSITDTRKGKAAVVVFYRGAWCPICNVALRVYEQQVLPTLASKGIVLIALSPQKPDYSITIAEKNALTFPVLSDPGNQIATALGTVVSHSEETKKEQAKIGTDVASTNADGTHNIPMPAVFVLDAKGNIVWREVQPNYAKRTEPADILRAVESL